MREVDYKKKIQEITAWIGKTVKDAGFHGVVVAVSGGIDSATSLQLAVQALGKDNVYALMLPYGDLSKKASKDAQLAIAHVGLGKDHVFTVDIKKAVDTLWEGHTLTPTLSHQERENMEGVSRIRQGNMMARVRMIYLFDMAKKYNLLVCGTENLTEHYLGYFTRFGDEASDLEPIRGLYKTQVFEIAQQLGVPKEIIEKAPSANLWEGQSDEGEFGFSYEEADTILYHYFEEKLPVEGIVALGIPKEIVEKVLAFVQKNDFKHHVPHLPDHR